MNNSVFLVKFVGGYYAKKQKHWDWSFTDDIYKAKQYKSRNATNRLVDHAINISENSRYINTRTYIGIGVGVHTVEEYRVNLVKV